MLEPDCLFGFNQSHVVKNHDGHYLSHEVNLNFQRLVTDARACGFDIRIASAYRSFERQLTIWNEKVTGRRPVLNDRGLVLDVNKLSEEELVKAILRWSALPGTSRHHWGTDFDIYDAAALGSGQALKLNIEETERGGPFFEMYQWLDGYLERDQAFFRPYQVDRGGVAREPWHLSYRPLAEEYLKHFDLKILSRHISSCDIELKDTILGLIEEIYSRYVINI